MLKPSHRVFIGNADGTESPSQDHWEFEPYKYVHFQWIRSEQPEERFYGFKCHFDPGVMEKNVFPVGHLNSYVAYYKNKKAYVKFSLVSSVRNGKPKVYTFPCRSYMQAKHMVSYAYNDINNTVIQANRRFFSSYKFWKIRQILESSNIITNCSDYTRSFKWNDNISPEVRSAINQLAILAREEIRNPYELELHRQYEQTPELNNRHSSRDLVETYIVDKAIEMEESKL
jgi:hypothetical protein